VIIDGTARGELHFFSGGGAWIVLGALLVSVLAFLSLLAWPVLGGGGLAPLRATVGQLWADAASGPGPSAGTRRGRRPVQRRRRRARLALARRALARARRRLGARDPCPPWAAGSPPRV
jgi:hypothetical protein